MYSSIGYNIDESRVTEIRNRNKETCILGPKGVSFSHGLIYCMTHHIGILQGNIPQGILSNDAIIHVHACMHVYE
jgi:hypothetical protein